jgi:nucleoside-diphosphate-sugar epimerase
MILASIILSPIRAARTHHGHLVPSRGSAAATGWRGGDHVPEGDLGGRPISTAALPGAWRENDRIRREVSRNLVDAALAAGATRFVQESICFFYGDLGDRWIDEDVALDLPSYARSTADAEAQARRFTEAGGTGVVLRFGTFYGRHSQVPPALGRDGYVSSIHTDDAAAAVVGALRAAAGVYNVADDEPLTRREYAAAVAAAGGTRIRLLPPGALRLMGSKTTVLTRSQRVSNRRFRDATGWAPRHASARAGWRSVAAAGSAEPEPAAGGGDGAQHLLRERGRRSRRGRRRGRRLSR